MSEKFTVYEYKITDRSKNQVSPAQKVSEHRSLNAATKAAKRALNGCLFSGPSNVTEVQGGKELIRFVLRPETTIHGNHGRMSLVATRYNGAMVVEVNHD